MKFPQFHQEGVRNILCECVLLEADQLGHLCKPGYHYHDMGLPLRLWWLCDELCRNGALGAIRDFQRLE